MINELNPLSIYLYFPPHNKQTVHPDYEKLLKEQLIELLPHGAGIDGDWYIEVYSHKISCHNSFHLMNEVGFYDGWFDFTVDLICDPENRKFGKVDVSSDLINEDLFEDILDDIHACVRDSLKDYYEYKN